MNEPNKLDLAWKTLILFVVIGILGILWGVAWLDYKKWLGILFISINSFLLLISFLVSIILSQKEINEEKYRIVYEITQTFPDARELLKCSFQDGKLTEKEMGEIMKSVLFKEELKNEVL